MEESDFIKELGEAGLSTEASTAIVRVIYKAVVEALSESEQTRLAGFGSWRAVKHLPGDPYLEFAPAAGLTDYDVIDEAAPGAIHLKGLGSQKDFAGFKIRMLDQSKCPYKVIDPDDQSLRDVGDIVGIVERAEVTDEAEETDHQREAWSHKQPSTKESVDYIVGDGLLRLEATERSTSLRERANELRQRHQDLQATVDASRAKLRDLAS